MNIFKKSKVERHETSTEYVDDSFRNIDNDLSNLKTNAEVSSLNQEIMINQVDDLLTKYTSLKKGIRGAEGNGAKKRQLEHRLNENIQDLKRIKKDLEHHTYTNLTTYQTRIGELIYYFEHYEQIRQIITLGGRTSDIHSIIDSKQDAKKAKRYEKSDARYQQSMNKILHDTALTSLWNNDMERYEEYLEAVVNGEIEPSSHPFYKSHEKSFNLIKHTNPSLYNILVPKGTGRTRYVYVETIEGSSHPPKPTKDSTKQKENFTTRIGKGFGDVLSTIFPSIEKNPRQKQAWEQAGSLLALGGAIYMGVKVIKNVFSKKETNPNKRGKALGWGAGLLAFTNIDRIIKGGSQRIQDATNRHPSEKIKASTELFKTYGFTDVDALKYSEMHVGAPVATMSALHFIPIYEFNSKKIVEYKNNKFEFNYNNYERYVKACDWTNEQKNIVLAAGQKLKDDNSLDLGLRALGIYNQDKLDSLAAGSKTKTLAECEDVQAGWENCVEWVSSGVHAELFNQGLQAKDLESAKKVIEEYNQNGGNKLKKTDINKLIIKRMKYGLIEVNDSDKKYGIEDMINNPNIDLDEKTMLGFTNNGGTPIKFDSYKDLFDTVHLTDWIKYNFKGRPALTDNPFHIAFKNPQQIALGGCIEFDDTERYKVRKNETKVLKSRTLNKTSSLLGKNKQFYVDYLNNRRKTKGKHGYM